MQDKNWFHAPAFAHAWWQNENIRVLLLVHHDGELEFGTIRQRHSQDTDPNITCFASRPIESGETERFLSVLMPYASSSGTARAPIVPITTQVQVSDTGDCLAHIHGVTVRIQADGGWSVQRQKID